SLPGSSGQSMVQRLHGAVALWHPQTKTPPGCPSGVVVNSVTSKNQAWLSSHLLRPALGVPAPIFMSAASPSLNRIMVGIERTPYLTVVEGFSSMLSLTILTLPASSAESSSRTGAIARHGPHHSAQKSTT